MATQKVKQEITVDFAVTGAKKAENAFVGLDQKIALLNDHIQKSFKGEQLDTFSTKMDKLVSRTVSSFNIINKQTKALKEAKQNLNAGSGSDEQVATAQNAVIKAYQQQLPVLAQIQAEVNSLEGSTKHATTLMINEMNSYSNTLQKTLRGSVSPFRKEIQAMQKSFEEGTVNVTALKKLNSDLATTEKQLKAIGGLKLKFDKLVDVPSGLSAKVQQSIKDIQQLVKWGASSREIGTAIDKVTEKISNLATQTSSSMRNAIKQMNDYKTELSALGSSAFNQEIGQNRTAVTKGTADPDKIKNLNARIKDNIAAFEKLAQVEQKLGLVSGATEQQQAKLTATIAKMKAQLQGGAGVKAIATNLSIANEEYKQLSNTVSTSTEKMAGNMLDLFNSIKHLNVEGMDKLKQGVAEVQRQINSGSVDKSFLTTVNQDVKAAAKALERFEVKTQQMGRNFRQVYKGMNEQVNSFRVQIAKRETFATEEALQKAEQQLKSMEEELKKYDALQRKASQATNLTEKELEEFEQALHKGQQGLEKFKNTARSAKDELSKSASKMKGFKRALGTVSLYGTATTVIFKLVEGIRAAAEAAVQFDKSMRTLAAVTKTVNQTWSQSIAEATQLQNQIVDLGIAYGKTNEELSNVALELARAGTATRDLADATEITIKLAALTGDTVESSTKAVVSYVTVFESATLTIEDLGDKLAYMANQSRLSTTDINTFSNFALTAAKSVGLTIDQVGGLAIALSNAGNNASTIGTQMRRFSTTLTDTDRSVTNFFQSIGVNQAQLAADIANGTEGSLKNFVSRLAEFSTQEFAAATADLNILTKQVFQGMRNNAEEINRAISGSMSQTAGELEKAIVVTESLENQLQSLKNTALQVGPALQAVGQYGLNFTEVLLFGFESVATGIGAAFDEGKSRSLQILAIQGELKQAAIDGQSISERGTTAEKEAHAARIKALKVELKFYQQLKRAEQNVAAATKELDPTISPEGLASIKKWSDNLTTTSFSVKQVTQDYVKLLELGDNAGASKLREVFSASKNGDSGEFFRITGLALKQLDAETIKTIQSLQEYKKVVKESTDKELKDNIDQTAKSLEVLTQRTDNYISDVIRMTNSGVAAGESLDNFSDSIAYSYELLGRVEDGLRGSALAQIQSKAATDKLSDSQEAQAVAFLNSVDTVGDLASELSKLEKQRASLGAGDKAQKAALDALIFAYRNYSNGLVEVQAKEKALDALGQKSTDNIQERTNSLKELLLATSKLASQADAANQNRANNQSGGADNIIGEIEKAKRKVAELKTELGNAASGDKLATGLIQQMELAHVAFAEMSDEQIAQRLENIKKAFEAGTLAATTENIQRLRDLKAYEKARKDIAINGEKTQKALNTVVAKELKLVQTIAAIRNKVGKTQGQTDKANTVASAVEGGATGEALAVVKANASLVASKQEQLRLQARINKSLVDAKVTSRESVKTELDALLTKDNLTSQELNRITTLQQIQSQIAQEAQGRLDIANNQVAADKASLALQTANLDVARAHANLLGQTATAKDPFSLLGGKKYKVINGVPYPADDLEIIDDNGDVVRTEHYDAVHQAAVDAYNKRLDANVEFLNKQRELREQDLQDRLGKLPEEAQAIAQAEAEAKQAAAQDGLGSAYGAANTGPDLGNDLRSTFDQGAAIDEAIQKKAALDVALLEQDLEAQRQAGTLKVEQEQVIQDEINQVKEDALQESINNQIVTAAAGAGKVLMSVGGAINDVNEAFGNQSRGAFESAKALNIAGATIATYASAVNAYNSTSALPVVGPALAPVAATAAIAAGLANIAKIKNQQYKPKKYHTGGPVTRQDALAAQRGDLRPDEVPATLQTGEYVMSRSEVAAAKAPQVNVEGNSQETVIINTTDDSVMESWAESRAGRNVINNIVNRGD